MAEVKDRSLRVRLIIAAMAVGLIALTLILHRVVESRRAAKPDLSKPVGVARVVSAVGPTGGADAGFVGVVLSRQAVQVAPKFEGPLATVRVRMGDEVKEGDLIAMLDTSALKKELAVAQAVVLAAHSDERKARAELAELKVKLETAKRIEKYVSAAELAGIESQYNGGVAKVESAQAVKLEKQARVLQLKETLSNTEIRAPFAGIVAARYADPGAIVSQTKPIVRLVSADRLLRFAVPEEQRSAIHVGQNVNAVIESQNVHGFGVVEKVAPEVDSASGTVFVEASLNNAEKLKDQLPSGSLAHVSIK